MAQSEQNLANHARYVPLFHIVLAALVAVYFFHAVRVFLPLTEESAWRLVGASALLLMYWYVRAFPLAVQDRVIRLEERLRCQVLAPDVAVRFDELRSSQVVALRFASDAEMPALAREVLAGKLANPADIKRAVKQWRADHWRA